MNTRRIAIVGAGSVGSTLAYQLRVQGIVPEFSVLVRAIVRDERRVLPVSTVHEEYCGARELTIPGFGRTV